MSEESQQRPRRGKLWLAAGFVALVLALIVVPPYIGISRYKHRITQLVSAALGRPVRLSGVELRLLPRPGFVLTDLTVEEDPAYGSEPVLHASTVDASIRFASLWRGQLQISRISVDEASVNLVRAADGRWNLDSLFRNAAAGSGRRRAAPRPYLEATNSRINIKNGLEKLPFSLLAADAALWQESDGEWRVRIEGQPARTDVSLDLGDTGIVRIEGTLRPAPGLDQMPLHLDAEWRDAQLGQLSRLLLGSDEGWRGDLRGELHLDGTAASAHVQASLRATGVHREEFAPAAPLDFGVACRFVMHYGSRSVDALDCSLPLGDGHARLTGNIAPPGHPMHLALDMVRIPAQAGLDVLRTVRNQIDPSLQAAGVLSGHLLYDPAAASASPMPQSHNGGAHNGARHAPPGPLTGSLALDGFSLDGDSLARPIAVTRMTLEPAPVQPEEHTALITSFSIPAGGPAPLSIRARLALAGFELELHGPASIPRLREFAHFTGAPEELALSQLAGEPAAIDLNAAGPWMAPVEVTLGAAAPPPASSVHVDGALTLHDANWKPSFLANAVLIHRAILHLGDDGIRWDPVEFSYGPVKGSATLALPVACVPPGDCDPQFTAHFGNVDIAEVESALLGARQKGTLLSSLLARINSSAPPSWPAAKGSVQADSVTLGPFVLSEVSANLKVAGSEADLDSLNASLFGGTMNGEATLKGADKPHYTLNAAFTGLKPALVGDLLGMKWTGGSFAGNGKVEMSGFTDKDLAASSVGTFQFDWRKGSVKGADMPPALASFDRFSGTATIAGGTIIVSEDKVLRGARSTRVRAEVSLAVPRKIAVSVAKR